MYINIDIFSVKRGVIHFFLSVRLQSPLWTVALRLRYELGNLRLCKSDSVAPSYER